MSPLELKNPIATEHFHHDIFITEFNIYFGYPRSDTCDTCDLLKCKTEDTTEESEKRILEAKLETHQAFAKTGYETFHYDQELSKRSWKSKVVHQLPNVE